LLIAFFILRAPAPYSALAGAFWLLSLAASFTLIQITYR